jgi:hypothetical protein
MCERNCTSSGALTSLSKKLGRRPKKDAKDVELERLRRVNQRLEKKLEQAELIIDVQKKLSRILDVELPTLENGD